MNTLFRHLQWGRVIFLLLTTIFVIGLFSQAEAADTPVLYLFWGDGCPHCEDEKEFLQVLHQRYPKLEMRWFETWNHQEFQALAEALRNAYAVERSSVPLTILGTWTMVGFRSPEDSGVQIEEQVTRCFEHGCEDALAKLGPHRLAAKIKTDMLNGNADGWDWFPAAQSQND